VTLPQDNVIQVAGKMAHAGSPALIYTPTLNYKGVVNKVSINQTAGLSYNVFIYKQLSDGATTYLMYTAQLSAGDMVQASDLNEPLAPGESLYGYSSVDNTTIVVQGYEQPTGTAS
jgi:hypothetical protein